MKLKPSRLASKRRAALGLAVGLWSSLALSGAAWGAYSAPQASPIQVLPVHNAKFMAGQRFDFLVEVKDPQGQDLQVQINGQDAEAFFGKKARRSLEGSLASYRIDQVSLQEPGAVEISVKAGDASRQISYSVTGDVAPQRAKNVILYVGDGMSLQARQIARILSKGMTEGKYNGLLEMEKMPHLALITTSGYDSLVTDSANSASAYATGHKSVVNAMGVYADSTPDPLDDPKVENLVEIAKRTRGMATGLVSTSNITDATPAAMVAHTRRRSEQNFIAQDMLNQAHRPDVILGGGSRHFLPQSVPGSRRTDDLDLAAQFQQEGYYFSSTRSELQAAPAGAEKLLGLYNWDNMNVYIDRAVLKDPQVLKGFEDQPGLVEMTEKAIEVLSQNPQGFFLMVEGACIDKQLHLMDWQRAAYDNIEFDQAVAVGRRFAQEQGDTLLIVVADHAHGASITGTYHQRDGKTGREAVRTYADSALPTFEDLDGDGFPDDPDPEVTLAVQFANHPDVNMDYRFKKIPADPTVMEGDRAVANPAIQGEFYRGNIPVAESQEVHAADDVILNAEGPGAEYFHGVMDNTEVFFGMVRALGLAEGR